MTAKIVVVGSINLDLVAHVSRMPEEGETLLGSEFATFPGGKGGNQAVAATRLGAEVAMVGRLGKDAFAQQLRSELDRAGVDTRPVQSVESSSGTAMVLVTQQGANSIVVIPGANATLRPEHLEEHEGLFRDAGVVLSQLEIPLDTVEHLGHLLGKLGIPFVLDPTPAQPLSPEILRSVTWLTPNESETRNILESIGSSLEGDPTSDTYAVAAAKQLLDTGVRNVILKRGDRGVYLAGKDVEAGHVASYRVRAVDTTAAGDAFNGGFAYGITHRMPPMDAARFASAAAAISVTRAGAQPSMPTLSEVKALMDAR